MSSGRRNGCTFRMYSNISSPDHPGILESGVSLIFLMKSTGTPGSGLGFRSDLLPVIIVLLASSDDECSVHPRAATKELASAQLDLSTVDTIHRFSDDVPVGLRIEVLGPAANHVHIFEVLVVWASLNNEDRGTGFFSEPTGYDAA